MVLRIILTYRPFSQKGEGKELVKRQWG